MAILTPDDVKKRFGPLFAQKFIVMVDEARGSAEIIEGCRHRGTIEWDAMNRRRAGGAVDTIRVDGTAMTMRATLGLHPVHFGAADREIGGQALEGVEVAGDEVVTTWRGIAGAGVGVAACLPQAPGVLRTEYPTPDDLQPGGARQTRVKIVSPRYEKVTIGIDDTDTKEEGATWVLALQCAEACRMEGVEYLSMRLIQLNPAVPKKTTNCVGTVLTFAARPDLVDTLCETVREFIETRAVSGDTGIAVLRGLAVPASPLARRVKTEFLTVDEVEEEALRLGIRFIDHARSKGRIGALGSLLWADAGSEAAGLYGEHL
ncbi:MAG: tRNA(Ile2) 2-agmatinylcytidine synthetase [Methanomicrobiales archaeon]|nr:tRNA(Ile2) 2-agmatinylcytidine synthetase [Methanomicrobiales archaeon]